MYDRLMVGAMNLELFRVIAPSLRVISLVHMGQVYVIISSFNV